MVQAHRVKFVAKLVEQKLLLEDLNYVRTVQRWTKVDCQRQAVTKQQAARALVEDRSRRTQVTMSIKFGAKRIEFERGKPRRHRRPSKDKLPAVIDTLISAVRAGGAGRAVQRGLPKTGWIGKSRKAV